jgi:octaprenyl-diphosphate synthase
VPSLQTEDSAATLSQELVEVEQAVLASLTDLTMPFAQLVQSQWRRNHPLVRGAFVLTAGAGWPRPGGTAPPARPETGPELHRKRIYLAAAMETLRLALGVHTELLNAETPNNVERSLLGSTVLAGDFCFSRSAGLAAKTGSPVIVDLFAHALQRVSEGSLRGLFRPGEDPYDAERDLCLSGIAAANELADLPPPAREQDQQLGLRLLDAYRQGTPLDPQALVPEALVPPAAQLAPARLAGWQALAAWLAAQVPA